ncbi:GNAT family N-acetyltransferase [Roseibium sp. SCP14]|uniref:GNAT family N-acetyltransferase n=1 Tax=Roseibium sp. SCP14 TaxID=3141375 RepID=UPI003336933B
MISFRPVSEKDLPLLSEWLARPHWREWWGDPETELGYIKDMIEGRDTTRPFIFQLNGTDKGYIQVWFVKDQQDSDWIREYPWLELLPRNAVGVDLSLADQDELSKGIGTEVLRAFVRKLRREGYDRILIDPDPENLRAVKAYRKAGFREIADLMGRTGDCLLMEHQDTEGVS